MSIEVKYHHQNQYFQYLQHKLEVDE